MRKRLILLFMAITLVAGLGVTSGCFGAKGGASGVVAIDLVPQTANFAASVNLNRVLADADVQDVISEIAASAGEPKTFDELLNLAKEETGVDFRDFSEMLVFGEIGNADYVGAIAKGSFNQAALITSIKNATGEQLSATDYKGYKIYSSPSDKTAVCFITSDTLIGGSTAIVKDTIDVKERAPSLDEPIYDTYKAMGDAWVTIALGVPAETMAVLTKEAPLTHTFLRNMEAIGFSFNKVGDNPSFQLKVLFINSASAEDAKGMFDVIKGMVAIATDVPHEVSKILGRLNVVQSDAWLTLSLEATKAEIEAWAQGLAPVLQLTLTFLQNMEAIGFSFNEVGDNLSFQLKVLFINSASAEDAKGMFDLIKGMVAIATDVPHEVVEILGRLNVVQSDAWLTLSLEATKAEIEAWAQGLPPALQPGVEKVAPREQAK